MTVGLCDHATWRIVTHTDQPGCGREWMTAAEQARLDTLFEQLFEEYHKPIFNYVFRLTGERALAEELAQDVFVRAYRALGRLPADANHRAWLYRIATNAAYDQLRRRKLVQWLPLMNRDRPTESLDEDVARTSQDNEDVHQALQELAPPYRAALILYVVQGYSVAEIGEMMSISAGAVKTRLYRAREMFRKVYRGDAANAL